MQLLMVEKDKYDIMQNYVMDEEGIAIAIQPLVCVFHGSVKRFLADL